ncbi:guanine nucleotide exchange factor MSS4-like [Ptychodera flava]|uniref:guanine nucleotide exchange factor MSS4-like n=1 Tax=Ptychodera flava TaxID=63121 RepID=UPI00396A386E
MAEKDVTAEGGGNDGQLKGIKSEDGKNLKTVVCQRCQSKVLKPESAVFAQTELYLPHMKKKGDPSDQSAGETLTDFWLVDDMFTFENVGFTNTVENIKYLICADCEEPQASVRQNIPKECEKSDPRPLFGV